MSEACKWIEEGSVDDYDLGLLSDESSLLAGVGVASTSTEAVAC